MRQAHLLPFLWLRGEGAEAIRQGVAAIAEAGCGAFCAESRTHPDYLGVTWWRDIDVLTSACKEHGLTYYLLDDTHFPSGFANGAARGTPWQRMLMTERHMDVVGPKAGGYVLAQPDGSKETLVAVVAGRRTESHLREEFVDLGGWAVTDLIDLTECVQDGLVHWDVPEGVWRVFVLTASYVTERNPPQAFVNPLLPQGGQLMIQTVYQAHYDHLGAEFGQTFRGFFSDEPALRAGRGCKAVLGEYPQLPIPWRLDMPELLSLQLGVPARRLLPGLWYDIGPDTPRIRYALMDTVSRLYAECYSQPIGEWCRAHGVQYIGHVIEQNGAHSRLGQGAGHFFRAMSGQDMAGMDYVLHELKPEFRDTTHAWKSQDFEASDDFFRYMLPQMTVSCAQLDPKKQGRALCEIFGAYGWQEDMAEMRYLANLLLSRGINYFTPHAFSLQPCPDPDSPPHFGAFNPLEPFIGQLLRGMERCAEELDGGVIPCQVGVLYHAEAEWACGKETMQAQAVVKVLNQRQIFCEIVPVDDLRPGRYKVLFIPKGRLWPRKLFERVEMQRKVGCRIVFVEAWPQGCSDGDADISPLIRGCECVPLTQVADYARRICTLPVQPCEKNALVHCTPYEKSGRMILVLFNEDDRQATKFRFCGPLWREAVAYDPLEKRCYSLSGEKEWQVSLQPGQLVLVGEWRQGWPEPCALAPDERLSQTSPAWQVRQGGNAPSPVLRYAPVRLTDLFPRYAGVASCQAEIVLPSGCSMLELEAYGAVRVFLDGQELGTAFAPPYRFAVGEARPGTHTLTVEFTLPLFFRHRDPLSFFNYIQPVGMQGSVIFLGKKQEKEEQNDAR